MFQLPHIDTTYPPQQTDEPLVPTAGPHTRRLWSAALPFFRDIMATPFVIRMGDGTLPAHEYRYYLQQDNHYLGTYISGLRSLGTSAPDAAASAFWNYAAVLSEEEVDSHNNQLKDAPPTAAVVGDGATGAGAGAGAANSASATGVLAQCEPSPCNFAYQSFLREACATQPYVIGAAAMLPCFWTYPEVALRLLPAYQAWAADHPGEQHPYEEWITLYASDEFVDSCQKAIGLVEQALAQATPEDVAVAVGEFAIGTLYEVMFFDQSRLHFS